jgi:putative hydroxymethylpyrimidine transport system substrate-binding protein
MKGVRALLALSLCVAAGALGACSEREERTGSSQGAPLSVMLDFYVNPDHAGLVVAERRGYFEQAGLEVDLRVPSDPSAPLKQVAAGRSDLAISYEPEVLTARSEGLPVKAIAAIVDEPLTSLIWLPESGIVDPVDLSGKTVATAGIPYQDDYLDTILDAAGVPAASVSRVNVGYGLLPALLGGEADAILGGFRNIEGVQLTERGDDPTVLPVDRVGVPTYDELVLVASDETIEERGDDLGLFISALAKGTELAIDDPELATRSVLAAGDGLDPSLTAAEVEATLPLLEPPENAPFGWMNPNEWANFAAWMKAQGLIGELPSVEESLTSEFLPPAPEPR